MNASTLISCSGLSAVYDRLVTEMLEHAPEQTPDILVGLAYQHSCHHERWSTALAGNPGGDWYEPGMSLQGGADDYVVKPFGPQELTARVQALLRRSDSRGERQQTYADSLLTIDFAQRAVCYRDRQVQLTPLEFGLLSAFVRNPNQVLGREQLLELVWGDAYNVSPEQVKLYVGYLRHKLDPIAPQSTPIQTVRGFGYRYQRTPS
jgi:DNA-binding response OmpR family regulator